MLTKKCFRWALAVVAGILLAATQIAHAQGAPPVGDLLLDAADSNTGWASSGTTVWMDSSFKKEGNASLKVTGTGVDRFVKAFSTSFDVSKMRYFTFWYFIDRPDLLQTTGDAGTIELTSAGKFDSEEMSWPVSSLHLQRGWNYVVLDLPGSNTSADGTAIDLTRVNFFRIYHRQSAAVTTRIDRLAFTNRDPRSFALSQYFQQKRIAVTTTAAQLKQLDSLYAFIHSPSTNAQWEQQCRRLTIDLTLREINGETLKSMKVNSTVVDNAIKAQRIIKQYMCSEITLANGDTDLQADLRARAATDAQLTRSIASTFKVTFEASAEMKDRLLQFDLSRIMSICGGTSSAIDAYVSNGTLPSQGSNVLAPGANVLAPNCKISSPDTASSQIASYISGLSPQVSDRKTAFQSCMASFEAQGSECDNPYASPDDDYLTRLRAIPGMFEQQVQKENDYKNTLLAFIEDVPLDVARNDYGFETHSTTGTTQLETLHQQYDVLSAESQRVKNIEKIVQQDSAIQPLPLALPPGGTGAQNTGVPGLQLDEQEMQTLSDAMDRETAYILLLRLVDEQTKIQNELMNTYYQICSTAHNIDVLCFSSPPAAPPNMAGDPTNPSPDVGTARCANMDLGGNLHAWFETPAGASGLSRQLNEGDRINHCTCELFDRGYGQSLPGNIVMPYGNCPTPEERTAEKCLENPLNGTADGVRSECRFLMQPISSDHDALNAGICKKMLPNCDKNAVYTKSDGTCGCGTLTNQRVFTPKCSTGLPFCLDGVVAEGDANVGGCGCQPYFSGAGNCSDNNGGKDFFLTSVVSNLVVRDYPDRPGYQFDHIMVAKGGTRFVTPAIQQKQLSNGSQLTLRAVLPGTASAYAGATGQIKVSCITLDAGATYQTLNTTPLSSLSTTGGTVVNVSLVDAQGNNRCFKTGKTTAYFEIFVNSTANQPVGFIDILSDNGNIFAPIKPACTPLLRNNPAGPRPLNQWPAIFPFSDGSVINTANAFEGVGTIPAPVTTGPTFPVCIGPDGSFISCN